LLDKQRHGAPIVKFREAPASKRRQRASAAAVADF
jgi:hypothetical protein